MNLPCLPNILAGLDFPLTIHYWPLSLLPSRWPVLPSHGDCQRRLLSRLLTTERQCGVGEGTPRRSVRLLLWIAVDGCYPSSARAT